jgi:DNA-binding winged helix-turn-helix (wHTH) protein/tetratricopeptide (TPR) repeat protein
MQGLPGRANCVRFSTFEADFHNGELRKNGVRVRIQSKPLAVLFALVERPGELVSREELYKALWPDETFVDFDKNLSIAVNKLREALCDSATQPLYIETVPKRGYRFLAPIEDSDPPPPLAPSSEPVPAARAWRWPLVAGVAVVVVALIGLGVHFFPLHSKAPAQASPAAQTDAHAAPAGTNPEAYQDFVEARTFNEHWIVSDLKSAEIFVNRSIALDSNYAPAFALRSSIYLRLSGIGGIERAEAIRKSRADAEKAIALDPSLAAGYVSLARIQMGYDWDWKGAQDSLNTARRLAPRDINVVTEQSMLYRALGRIDDSIAMENEAIKLDPLKPSTYAGLAIRLIDANRYDEAFLAQQRALELDPQIEYIHLTRAEVLLAKGLPQDALREVQNEPGEEWSLLGKTIVYHDLDRSTDSDSALSQLIAHYPDEFYTIAIACAYRDEPDKAFDWLQRAFEYHDEGLTEIKLDPALKKLHGDPRYTALLRRIHLSDSDLTTS